MDQTCEACHCLAFDMADQRDCQDQNYEESVRHHYRTQEEIRRIGRYDCKFCHVISLAVETFGRVNVPDTCHSVRIDLNRDGRIELCMIGGEAVKVQLYCPPGIFATPYHGDPGTDT